MDYVLVVAGPFYIKLRMSHNITSVVSVWTNACGRRHAPGPHGPRPKRLSPYYTTAPASVLPGCAGRASHLEGRACLTSSLGRPRRSMGHEGGEHSYREREILEEIHPTSISTTNHYGLLKPDALSMPLPPSPFIGYSCGLNQPTRPTGRWEGGVAWPANDEPSSFS